MKGFGRISEFGNLSFGFGLQKMGFLSFSFFFSLFLSKLVAKFSQTSIEFGLDLLCIYRGGWGDKKEVLIAAVRVSKKVFQLFAVRRKSRPKSCFWSRPPAKRLAGGMVCLDLKPSAWLKVMAVYFSVQILSQAPGSGSGLTFAALTHFTPA